MKEIIEFDDLVGLTKVKEKINQHLVISKQARKNPDSMHAFSMHMIFRGNLGTGKTKVAKIIASIYKREGILKKGEVQIVSSPDLICGYAGQSPEMAMIEFKNALGGCPPIAELWRVIK